MDWFLYDNGLRHERVKKSKSINCLLNSFKKGDKSRGVFRTLSKHLRWSVFAKVVKQFVELLKQRDS